MMNLKISIIMVSCLVTLNLCASESGRINNPDHENLTNEVRSLLNSPFPAVAVTQYASENNLPLENLVDILKYYASNTQNGYYSLGISRDAIAAIGNLRREECLPFLEDLSLKASDADRFAVVGAVAAIGGSRAAEFANTICRSTNIFSYGDRFHLYDESIHSLVALRQPSGFIPAFSENDHKFILEFFMATPCVSEKLTSVLSIDEQRCNNVPGNDSVTAMVSRYRISKDREAVLSYFTARAPSPYREEFAKRLQALQNERQAPTNLPTVMAPVAVATPSFQGLTNMTSFEKLENIVAPPSVAQQNPPHTSYVLIGAVLVGLAGLVIILIRR